MSNLKNTIAIILHFRTPEKTLACLKSIVQQSITNIILVDNSEDNGRSLAQIEKKIKIIQDSGVLIHTLSKGKNQGFAKAINTGYVFAKENGYKHLFIINSDAIVLENCIAIMHAELSTYSICAPLVCNAENSQSFSLFGFYQPLTGLNFSKKKLCTFKYISGCCLLIKIDDFKAPLLDEDFFFYGEDVVFSYNIKDKIKIKECANAFIQHEGSGSSKNGSIFYEYHINRWHLLTASKLSKNKFELLLYLLFRCITLPARAILRCVRHGNFIALYGLLLSIYDLLHGKYRSLTPPVNQKD